MIDAADFVRSYRGEDAERIRYAGPRDPQDHLSSNGYFGPEDDPNLCVRDSMLIQFALATIEKGTVACLMNWTKEYSGTTQQAVESLS